MWHGDGLAFMRALPTASVDMIFTDPPYGLPFGRKSAHVAGDDATSETFRAFLPEAVRVLRPGACLCCCAPGGAGGHYSSETAELPVLLEWSTLMFQHPGLQLICIVVWDKGMGTGWRYRSAYETVIVAARRGAPMAWYGDHRVGTVLRGVRRVGGRGKHPTEKPAALAAHFIGLHTRPGDLVLDPFCGYGSTGVAAVGAGRRFMGVEIVPAYAAEAAKRVGEVAEALTVQLTAVNAAPGKAVNDRLTPAHSLGKRENRGS